MLKNFFSFNSLELQGSYKLHKLIFLTIITGLYYTLFLNNTSAEYVEFAQTLAGMIPINVHNDFYLFRQSDSSLQILLPAILLKMNLSDAFVGTVASFVCQTTAFLAAVLLVYYLDWHYSN